MKPTVLAPTFWRTCRVLACERRLKILATVLEKEPVCVKDVARICRMPDNTATQYLRALQSRGLLAAQRKSRWVYYASRADPSVQHADLMLTAMRKAMETCESQANQVAMLTAYTHPRRISIVRRLAAGPARVEQLARDTDISLPACYRHLEKLMDRAVIEIDAEDHYQLAQPLPGLATALLHAAIE